MGLSNGSRLGPYEIQSAIGAGGMGEVYRAHDPRLKRDVALKVLPQDTAADPERRARFEREAQAIAALNHPNIVTIHSVEDASGVLFLTMELVEGQALDTLIAHGGLPLPRVLALAIPLADAVSAAHQKGITHRDLKPANAMVTPDGRVKVLDFGVAKLLEPAATPVLATVVPTVLTSEGRIVGTVAYMSPEQAEGKAVDHRSDIFSLGVMLYELTTGARPFTGDTPVSTITSILRDTPRPVTELNRTLPRDLALVIRRCLAKNPEQRTQSAKDLRNQLEDLQHAMDSGELQASGSTNSITPHVSRLGRRALLLVAVAMIAIVALSVPAVIHLREKPASSPEVRLELTTPATRQPLHFAISPDGEQLVFVASGDGAQRLWIRPLSGVTARPIEGTEGAEYPFWSPDSRQVGFFASGELKRISITGGPPQKVTDAANGRGGAWNSEGTILFAPGNATALARVPASGGTPQPVTTLEASSTGSHRLPQFLPDGRRFIFFAQGDAEGQGIYLGSLNDSHATRLTPAEAAGVYAEPGVLLFLQQNTLLMRRLDLDNSTLTGDPVTVADRVSFDSGFGLAGLSISSAGRLAYVAGSERRQLTWFDRAGNRVGVAGEPDMNSLDSPALSPDGRRVMVMKTIRGNLDIWAIDTLRGSEARITSDPSNDGYAAWSPDGTRIALTSNRAGSFDLFLKASSSTGPETSILASPQTEMPVDWSRDGRFLLYQYGDPKTGWDLLALPMTGEDRKPIVVANTTFDERGGQFSPDGRWVAYHSDRATRFEVYVQPFPGPGDGLQVSTAGGTDPIWRDDGKELYFLAPNGTLMAVAVRASGTTIDVGTPVALFRTHAAVGGNANLHAQYAVSRDGRFLINVPDETPPITIVVNWDPGLEK